jgi:hypothetical protein
MFQAAGKLTPIPVLEACLHVMAFVKNTAYRSVNLTT